MFLPSSLRPGRFILTQTWRTGRLNRSRADCGLRKPLADSGIEETASEALLTRGFLVLYPKEPSMLIASNVSFTVAALALASLCFTAATAPGCTPAEHPSAEQVATEAREKLGQLVTALERVQKTAAAVADLAAAVTAARVAYDAGDYREALKQARAAVDAATRAGVAVPAEVGLRMAEAELLIGLVDG